jgi:hypothetical protein
MTPGATRALLDRTDAIRGRVLVGVAVPSAAIPWPLHRSGILPKWRSLSSSWGVFGAAVVALHFAVDRLVLRRR